MSRRGPAKGDLAVHGRRPQLTVLGPKLGNFGSQAVGNLQLAEPGSGRWRVQVLREAQKKAMQDWGAWFGTLGASVSDLGNPFSTSATVGAGGATDGGASKLGGGSIVEAASLADATARTTGCPVLSSGGTVGVYEAIAM